MAKKERAFHWRGYAYPSGIHLLGGAQLPEGDDQRGLAKGIEQGRSGRAPVKDL